MAGSPPPAGTGGKGGSKPSAGASGTTAGRGGTGGKGGSSAAGAAGNTNGCAPFERPEGVPPDWEEYTDYSCGCRLYTPGKTGSPAAPIEWAPCPPPTPEFLKCQYMKPTWDGTTGSTGGITASFTMSPEGKPRLQFFRAFSGNHQNFSYHIVADADGDIHNIFLKANPYNKGCAVVDGEVAGDRYVFPVFGDSWDGDYNEGKQGILAGDVHEPLPKLVKTFSLSKEDFHPNWYASTEWMFRRRGDLRACSWDGKKEILAYDPANDPEGLRISQVSSHGPDLFLSIGEHTRHAVVTWNEAKGLRSLIRWPGDNTKGAANFATDGKNMVWTYGEGNSPDGLTFEKFSVMTAPFSTDEATVAKTTKRLHSDPGGISIKRYVTGCGYAAIWANMAPKGLLNGLFVVRLSDGISWLIPGAKQVSDFAIKDVFGITCDEVFVTMKTKTTSINIARIRLDSLGQSLPPD